MKKRVLSLLVLIGCVSVFCLLSRKKADCLQQSKENQYGSRESQCIHHVL